MDQLAKLHQHRWKERLKISKVATLVELYLRSFLTYPSQTQQICSLVPPFVTAHTFSASLDIQISQGICPPTQQYFCAVYHYMEKADLSKGYQNPKKILGVTTYFLEIIEITFEKKCHTFFVF